MTDHPVPMVQLPLAERVLWHTSTVLIGLLAVRLWQSGLYRSYPCFALSVVVGALRSIILLFFQPGTFAYGLAWLISEPLVLLFHVLVVLELYTLILRDYTGIATVSRRSMTLFVAIAVGISVITLLPDINHPATRSPWIVFAMILQRGILTSLLVFLLLMLGFLAWYPIQLSRNTLRHSVLFVIFFSSRAASVLYFNLSGEQVTRDVSLVLLGISATCLAGWLLALQPAGEAVPVRAGMMARDGVKLIQQLNDLNALLQRSSRK